MPAVLARHQLEDGARLPVPSNADYDAFIGPLHELFRNRPQSRAPLLLRKLQPHGAVSLRVVAPALAHLHEQEQVHLVLADIGDSFHTERLSIDGDCRRVEEDHDDEHDLPRAGLRDTAFDYAFLLKALGVVTAE